MDWPVSIISGFLAMTRVRTAQNPSCPAQKFPGYHVDLEMGSDRLDPLQAVPFHRPDPVRPSFLMFSRFVDLSSPKDHRPRIRDPRGRCRALGVPRIPNVTSFIRKGRGHAPENPRGAEQETNHPYKAPLYHPLLLFSTFIRTNRSAPGTCEMPHFLMFLI
jgi:hypothetical protein